MTTLSAGDIAVIGYSSAAYNAGTAPLGKSIAVVLLKAVDAGTVISFTDDGWFANGGGGFRSGEGVLTYTAPTGGAAAGTVISFTNQTGSFNLSTSGDQVTVFQGTDTPASTGHATSAIPLFSLDYASSGAAYTDATSTNTTALATGLTQGATALLFNGLNGAYTGPTSGTAAQLLAAIDTASNWTLSTTAPAAYATTFTVTGGNVAPVFTGGANATTSAPENTPATTVVYTAAATDGDNDTLTYSLSGADAAKFNIDAATGAVTFKASPDFEAPGSAAGTNTYSFNAVVTDGAPGNHVVSQAVTLTVTDANDNAPVITSGAAVSVPSGTAAGATVYTVAASDVDTVNGARTYALGGTDAAKFNIDANTGAVSFKTAPNYYAPDDAGADHVYDLTVTANDGVNTSAAKAVQVTVTNTNQNPPVFTSGATASTPENVATTTAVYTAHATDADGDAVAYSLVSGGDAALFNIDPASGAVTFKASPDFERPGSAAGTNTYSFTVQASDGATVHNVTQAVTLTVTDVNDNAPVITSAASTTAPAGVATTTPVYTVAATDADSGPALTYAIAGGVDAAKFNINATTGAVTFKASPSYTSPDDAGADHTYDIVVQASDGVAAHNAAKAVAITVTNPNAGVLLSADFDGYTAAGLSPGAANAYAGATTGTLNSNVFQAVGFSDAQPGYGGSAASGSDYGRGALTANFSATTAGLYSGATAHSGAGDHALMILPTGAEFDVNGYVEVRVQNTTANTAASLNTAFDWVYDNKNTRSDNVSLSYSTDGVNYTAAPTSTNLTTPATPDTTPGFTYLHESVDLSNVVVAPGAYLYLRFTHTGSTGSGSRDAVGVDNLNVAYSDISHVPVLSVANISAPEGNNGTTAFTFTVQRAGDLSAATTVHYATADGTAVAGSDYTAVAGDLTFAAGETSKTVTVQVNGDVVQEPNETFTLNLSAAANATLQNSSATATIVNDDVSVTSIGDIQGAATTSPFVGSTVTTTGVVTAIKTGAGGGYYIQDPTNAGPAGASHGLFVFTAATPSVAVGDHVTVQGLVTEYAANANDRPITELNNPVTTVDSHGNAVTPVIIGSAAEGGILPPTSTIAGTTYDPVHNGVDFYESLEGQLVTIKNAQAVDATYSGSTWVVADLGVGATGMNARGGITAAAGDFDPERIQVYSSALTATMGEHLGDITGVITYYNGEYELIPTAAITPPGGSATAPPALARETTALKGDASHLSIGAYNLENLGPVEPGVAQATVDARFAQLGRDIAQNLGSPDILGVEEIQDADGEGTGSDLSGATTLNKLIAAIAAAGGPTYKYVEIAPTAAGTTGGAPGGNIRSAYLYNPARVGYVAGSAQLISDPNLSDGDAFNNSRKPLVAQFTFNGQTVTAIDIHDYARSGSEELFGLDQPAVNSGDQRRIDQTAAVKAYVAQLLAANPNADITVQGDFNAFQFETSLTQLAHSGGGQLNQLSDLLPAAERYSTTFEGIAQEIDHELVSDALFANARFQIVHLNTGQGSANQGSDHDPILSLLSVPGAVAVNAHAPVITSGSTASEPENTPASTVVYTVHATDADGDTLAYAFAGGADDAKFAIDPVTGAVTFKASPDYEAFGSAAGTNTYTVAVSASDGVAAHTVSQVVTITVTDVAETPAATATAPAQAPAGQTVTIDASGSATVTGTVADSGVAQFASAGSVTFTGAISGSGAVAKTGAGVLTFAGASTYTGATTVAAGTLLVDGSIAASPVTVASGAVLGGHGTTGAVIVQAGGSLSPGDSPGVLSTGSLTLGLGASLIEQIGGFAVGQFDAVKVTGTVTLTGALLSTSLYGGFSAPITGSQPLVIIDNDGTDAVVGTFAGLAEGAVFTLGGQQVRISYVGGTGNDVTLQFLPNAALTAPPTSTPAPTASQAAGYAVQTTNLLHVTASDPALSNPSSPLYAQAQAEKAIAAQLDAGQISAPDAQYALYHLVDGTISVAEISYAFFTGKTPTAAGLSYLVHSDANPTDLNDPYYAKFTTENRYINMAANLGRFGDASATAAFHQAYDSLSLSDATAKAYQAVFGTAATADKVNAILNSLVPDGLGGQETRAQYFAYYGTDGLNGIGTKSAMIGWLLADSVKEGFGTYQQADLHFLADLAHGTALYNVDLLAAYTVAPTLVGQPTTDLTAHG